MSLLVTSMMGFVAYFQLYFAAQCWLDLFSLLFRETRMMIVWRKIYLLEYSTL
jgi:hypothetical protein